MTTKEKIGTTAEELKAQAHLAAKSPILIPPDQSSGPPPATSQDK